MGGKSLIVTLVGMMVISSTIFLALLHSSSAIATNFTRYYDRQTAQNIAQSGANVAMRQVKDNPLWRTGWANRNILDGRSTVSLTDVMFQGRPAIRLFSEGVMNYHTFSRFDSLERRDTVVVYLPKGFVPATVKAAITTNNPVLTLGGIVVDGRDHLMNGALVANQGTLGVWTTGTFTRGGNSTIGGTDSTTHVDYPPAKPADSHTYAQNQTWPGGYPGSPDSILGGQSNGFPEGTLKAIAQSGIGGSRYVTDPSGLTLPLKGVTYVELPSGGTWQSMDITGDGILIVHNSARNAIMKNLNGGTFKGLMIVDDPVHIHATIIGALVGLTPSPSEGNCIGNSSGSVLYSQEAIVNATASVGSAAGGNSSTTNYLAWWE